MPLSRQRFFLVTLLLLIFGVLVVGTVAATTIWMAERSRLGAIELAQARDLRTHVANVDGDLQDAETSQRGFLLTNEPAYLAPYEEAIKVLPEHVRALVEGARVDPAWAAETTRLTEIAGQKLAELAETIGLARAGQTTAALEIVRADRGRQLMDDARNSIRKLTEALDARIVAKLAENAANAQQLRWVTLLGGLLILLAAGGAAWTVLSYTREIAAARTVLESVNEELDERVKLRTLDLERANSEIQRFAYIVSHDLRAPLVNVMGFTSELETGLEGLKVWADTAEADNEAAVNAKQIILTELPEAVGFIRSSTGKMDGLINAILKLAREGRRVLTPEPIDMRSMFELALANMEHRLQSFNGAARLEGQMPTIRSDRLAIDQVFGNLLDNAIKYRAPDRPPQITIRALPPTRHEVSFSVADNGRGIAESDTERVFELFRRAGAQNEAGEGIGLAHVRSLARRLGGDITLTSTLGQGSTFTVTIQRHLRTEAEKTHD